jgi:hypothetical protein
MKVALNRGEKMFKLTHKQKNADQNYIEILSTTNPKV